MNKEKCFKMSYVFIVHWTFRKPTHSIVPSRSISLDTNITFLWLSFPHQQKQHKNDFDLKCHLVKDWLHEWSMNDLTKYLIIV